MRGGSEAGRPETRERERGLGVGTVKARRRRLGDGEKGEEGGESAATGHKSAAMAKRCGLGNLRRPSPIQRSGIKINGLFFSLILISQNLIFQF